MDELILMAQAGDEEAFANMILYIKDDLYKIAKTRIANETDIEDAIQETMIETYKSIKRLKDPNKFKKFITKSIITSFSFGFDSAINKVRAVNVLLSITCLPFLYNIP